MFRVLLCFLGLIFYSYAQEVEILADRFTANQNTRVTHLIGNVRIKSLNDNLNAEEVYVYFNENNRPINYHAIGRVSFRFTFANNRTITGSGEEAFYNPQVEEYRLLGNAKVREIGKTNQVEGQEIQINRKTGFINVVGGKQDGEKRPARLIFTLDNNQTKIKNGQ